MNPQRRAGMAIHLILALLLSMVIITLTSVINPAKGSSQPGLLADIKADYQLESAVIMHFIRLQSDMSRGQVQVSAWDQKREVTPGIFLRSGYKKVGNNQFRIIAYLSGQGVERRFFTQALWREPTPVTQATPVTPLIFVASPGEDVGSSAFSLPASATDLPEPLRAAATASGSWLLEYLPDQGDREQ